MSEGLWRGWWKVDGEDRWGGDYRLVSEALCPHPLRKDNQYLNKITTEREKAPILTSCPSSEFMALFFRTAIAFLDVFSGRSSSTYFAT